MKRIIFTLVKENIMKKKTDNKFLSYSFKVDEFAMRGLNKYRNILSAPKRCPMFEDEEVLHDFCSEMLYQNGCGNSAIFLVFKDGKQEIVWGHTDEDDHEYQVSLFTGDKLTPVDIFAHFDADAGLHCYGLMIEKDNNLWEICE